MAPQYEDMEKDELVGEALKLWYRVRDLEKLVFGSKSERFHSDAPDPEQLTLDLGPEGDRVEIEGEKQQVTQTRKKGKGESKQKPSRGSLPEHLERRVTVIEPEEDTTGLKKIGEVVSEYLEVEPTIVYVRQIRRPKYAKVDGEGVLIADLPARPIDKSIAGPFLLAYILTSKYVDHLPLYRIMKMLARNGVEVNDSTMSDWVRQVAKLITPLYEALKAKVMNCGYIMADETSIPVLASGEKKKAHKGFYWVYYSPEERLALFDYQPGRGRAAPKKLLGKYQGYLQTDGYSVYQEYDHKNGVTLLGCMAHVRRKFYDAQNNDMERAQYVLELMKTLYAVERKARKAGLSTQERYDLRQKEAAPVMEKLYQWLLKNQPEVLESSPIGNAIKYALGRWSVIKRYLTNGRIEIDNNLVENQIRPVALGRKNYLFAGSHSAAQNAAMIYSLVGSCEKLGINPQEYLKTVLTRIASHPIKRIEELLPNNIKM